MVKHLLFLATLLNLGKNCAQADIALGAPGVPPGALSATKVPFKVSYELPGSYKFVFGGIQAKGNTLGAPGASGTNGNGGQFHVSATVSTPYGGMKEGNIEFRDVQDFNTSPWQSLLIVPAQVYRATTAPMTVNIEWKGEGNAHKPDGIFTVIGEYQKAPPPPVGSLSFAVGDYLLVSAGTQPPGFAVITRE